MIKTKILLVVGTRPNYIKVTQFKKIAQSDFKDLFDIKLVHTGQHFDVSMADVFFKQLVIQPDYFLNISKASPNTQMAEIMLRLETLILEKFKPDLVIVPGDVNSTLAAALTANKLNIPLAHLESGLRSFDRSMPEEINRILVDEISDYHFVTEQSGMDNLINEGKPRNKVFFVGNTMIDTLVAFEEQVTSQKNLEILGLEKDGFILITLHRPAAVDNIEGLALVIRILEQLTQKIKVVFPIHPRTKKNIQKFGFKTQIKQMDNLIILGPLDYFSFQNLISQSKMILTDSGGIQEEATFKQVPCLTLRPNTERPSTITIGSNTLLGFDLDEIMRQVDRILSGNYKNGSVPKLWDGGATRRILDIIAGLNLAPKK